MKVAITPHHKRYIRSKIESGSYESPDEVVRNGLRLLEEHDQRQRRMVWLQHEIEKGFKGPTTPWTKSDSGKIRQLVMNRAKKKR